MTSARSLVPRKRKIIFNIEIPCTNFMKIWRDGFLITFRISLLRTWFGSFYFSQDPLQFLAIWKSFQEEDQY